MNKHLLELEDSLGKVHFCANDQWCTVHLNQLIFSNNHTAAQVAPRLLGLCTPAVTQFRMKDLNRAVGVLVWYRYQTTRRMTSNILAGVQSTNWWQRASTLTHHRWILDACAFASSLKDVKGLLSCLCSILGLGMQAWVCWRTQLADS